MSAIYGALAALIGTVVLVFIVGLLSGAFRDSTRERVETLVSSPDVLPPTPQMDGKRDLLPNLTNLITGRGLAERLYAELSAAGIPIRPSEFLGIIAGSVLATILIASLFVRDKLGVFALVIIAAAIPVMVLRSMQAKRRALFDSQIVDALMMMASSLRSGFSFQRAAQLVSQEMPPPISIEFQRIINEVNVGRSLEDALRGVVSRVKSYDFDLVVTAVIIQLQVGGNLADILETIANTIRERVRINGEMRALTAEGRISGIVLIALPVVMGLVLAVINPTYMHVLIYESIGHYLIGAAVILQIIGAFVIKKMLVIDI